MAVVAVGGGGVPVVARNGRHDGIDAVIDKDRASAVLAIGLGADRLVILTQVPAVYAGFGTNEQRAVAELHPERDEGILAELPAGSMRPKVEAAFTFVRATGGEALITSADALEKNEAGTRVVPASP
jgi:carbamate kinase